MASTSLVNLVRELAERFYPGRRVRGTTTSSVDSASVLDSTNFADSDANVNQYNHVWIRVDEKTASGPSVGERQLVKNGGYAGSTGDFTTNAFTATVESGMDFSVHYTLDPDEKVAALNLALSNTFHRAYHPLSLVGDYDYDGAAALSTNDQLPTGWSESAGGVQENVNTDSDKVWWGRRSLGVDNNGAAANSYVQTDSLPCNEGARWFVAVPAATDATDTGDAVLRAYDVTNAATIDDGTSTQIDLTTIQFEFTIPSGCKQVAFRLIGSGTDTIVYWGPVVAYPMSRVVFNLPSWLDNSNRLSGVSWIPVGSGSGGSSDEDAYRTFEREPEPMSYTPFFSPLHANPNRVTVDVSRNGPAFLYAWRPFAELTEADTSPTTLMDHDTLIVGALAECHKKIAARLDRTDPDAALTHRRLQAEFENDFQSLLATNDYALPETEIVPPRRVFVRLP